MGVRPALCELAPFDVALLPGRCAVIRNECRRFPPGERTAPHGECSAAVSGAAADDGPAVAMRGGSGGLRLAPAACGIGGMGGGAQRRAEYVSGDGRAAA